MKCSYRVYFCQKIKKAPGKKVAPFRRLRAFLAFFPTRSLKAATALVPLYQVTPMPVFRLEKKTMRCLNMPSLAKTCPTSPSRFQTPFQAQKFFPDATSAQIYEGVWINHSPSAEGYLMNSKAEYQLGEVAREVHVQCHKFPI